MHRFLNLSAIITTLFLVWGIVSPAALFVGLGLGCVTLLLAFSARAGVICATLVTGMGVTAPLVIESYGSLRYWTVFTNPLSSYFTSKTYTLAFDTGTGTLILALIMAVIGAYTIASVLTSRYGVRVALASILVGFSVAYTSSSEAAGRTALIVALVYAIAYRVHAVPMKQVYAHHIAALYLASQMILTYRSEAPVPLITFLALSVYYVWTQLVRPVSQTKAIR